MISQYCDYVLNFIVIMGFAISVIVGVQLFLHFSKRWFKIEKVLLKLLFILGPVYLIALGFFMICGFMYCFSNAY